MTEAPIVGTAEEEARGLRTLGRSLASRVAHEHPTLVFTLAYLSLTVVGLIYDLWFYSYFRINILDYSETGDFLLAAIRNPLVIILSMLPAGMLLIGIRVRELAIRKSATHNTAHPRRVASIVERFHLRTHFRAAWH